MVVVVWTCYMRKNDPEQVMVVKEIDFEGEREEYNICILISLKIKHEYVVDICNTLL